MNDAVALASLVGALRPWLGKLVLVGGWAHRLHRLSSLASPPAHAPIVTLDADLAFATHEQLAGNVGAALRAAGFREQFFGEHTPPVSRYVLGHEGADLYAEFLAPLKGSGIKRSGQPDATLAKAGITAQKLRHLDVLLVAPMLVDIGEQTGFPLSPPAEARVANPVSFIAQKLLIRSERTLRKRAQDVLYVHDTLELFASGLTALADLWQRDVRPRLAARTAGTVERLAREQFSEVNDTIRAAARIPPDRTLTPENLRALCACGLEEVFGSRTTPAPGSA